MRRACNIFLVYGALTDIIFITARCHLVLESDEVGILLAIGELLLGREPEIQFVHPHICKY